MNCSKYVPSMCLMIFLLLGVGYSQNIKVSPKEGLVDERLSIGVTGLVSGQPVIIRARMNDLDGRVWQ